VVVKVSGQFTAAVVLKMGRQFKAEVVEKCCILQSPTGFHGVLVESM